LVYRNKNVDTSGTLKVNIFESQMIKNSLRARKLNGLHRIAKIGYGHL
jgi:hypothetical protein